MPTDSAVIYQIPDGDSGLKLLEDQMSQCTSDTERELLLKYPTVYIHNRPDRPDGGMYEVYIGETNDIIQRTKQHFESAREQGSWQSSMINQENARLYIIGHPHFNKSLTLDIENRLMLYMSSVPSVRHIRNLRGNEQGEYYTSDEFISIFNTIWDQLQAKDDRLFPNRTLIEEAAIFKASPFHKLTENQRQDKAQILAIIHDALQNNAMGQLVFVEGEAGTGKTVLNSSMFYDLCTETKGDGRTPKYNCHLLVNHDEQLTVYQQIAAKIDLHSAEDKFISKPTSFINTHLGKRTVDVAFIDEAHLLWTQGKQSYRGKDQLTDIRRIARVTVIMFDPDQQLHTQDYWAPDIVRRLRDEAMHQQSLKTRVRSYYFRMTNQFRIRGNQETINWIHDFVNRQVIRRIPADDHYEIKIFDDPARLDAAIREKAADEKTRLSRMLATFDWPYIDKKKPANGDRYWNVTVGNWKKAWNKQIDFAAEHHLTREQQRKLKTQSWAEQEYTIEEIGSTFTIQGSDLNYAGVILGPSVTFRNGRIVIDPTKSEDHKATNQRTLENGEKKSFGEQFIRNEVNILMTRGVDGLYIYAVDDELRKALLQASSRINKTGNN